MRSFLGAKTNGHPRFVKRKKTSNSNLEVHRSQFRTKRNFSYRLAKVVFSSIFSKFFTDYVL